MNLIDVALSKLLKFIYVGILIVVALTFLFGGGK